MCRLTKKWVGHQIQASSLLRSWCFPSYNSTLWSCPWPPTASTVCSWPSGQSEVSENDLKWFPMPKNIHLDTRTMFLACSEAELEFHSLKCFLTSYSPSTLFMAFRSIWGFLEIGSKWFLMPQNIGFATRTMFLACSEAEIDFHSLKCFLTSYSPFTLFMAFRSIWGFLKLVPNDSSCLKTLVLPPNSRL